MTGFIVRIKRADRWVTVDFDELTDDEFHQVEVPADIGWQWAVAMAKWIRDNVNPQPIGHVELRLHTPVDLTAADGADRANGAG